ncbi:alpha/beta fold hydrolase [Janthinobacterium agaricidamnosum]|uniref:Alpha/beta hydrolase fold family protein n=1 Tax=Janthinobacterium agaricidamnosum NBRC 102515 = DSM 9628 TaxID=1349767 RepID=W0V5I5_9BURK|nr:alpha/beta hydrolase [Janthinobacterium agaricidamnosum]CDG83146.1 alpha/beta hydrolase fold family protein [Janthinobacterium agaricidamnosum NBRC 102515 = DSM 9628]
MTHSTRQHTILTSHGSLAVEQSGDSGIPILFIHGNSTCRGVFHHQLQGQLGAHQRLITFDLPGHGQSGNAPDPVHSYTRPGFAEATVELLGKLGVDEAIVVGWSLGGHIGIEMMPHFAGLRGLMISGTPPVANDNMAQGFKGSPHMGLAGKQELSQEEVAIFAKAIFGDLDDPFLRNAMVRSDGRFRSRLFEAARAGAGVDQRQAVESSLVPLAVLNGADDQIVNLDYIDSLRYANLWQGECKRLDGVGHAPFWHKPAAFNQLLLRFAADVSSGRADAGAGRS